MSDHPKRPLAEMQAIAEAFRAELAPYCTRIEIAGSIRRQRPECADVELVCVPKIEPRAGADLFKPEMVNLLDQYCDGQLGDRWQHRRDKRERPAFGSKLKRVLVDGVPLDLFCVIPPAQWGAIFLIRTGSADFSRKMVTRRELGGYLPNDCAVKDGGVYRDGQLVEMPEESDFFALCGRAYLSPKVRA